MLAGIRHKTLLALGFVLLAVVIACSPSDDEAVPTAVAAPAVTPAAAPSSIQPPWGLLASLPVEVPAVLAAGPLLENQQENALELRTFTGFGMPKPDNPEMLSPQWKFTVPAGTPALAPVTGYVVGIRTVWSGDFSVWLSADVTESTVWEVEHVVDVQVKVGDSVEAGLPIATASDLFGNGVSALVELGLRSSVVNEEGRTLPAHYCPLLYVEEDAVSVIKAELSKIRMENFDRLTNLDILIPVNDPNGQSCWTELPIVESP